MVEIQGYLVHLNVALTFSGFFSGKQLIKRGEELRLRERMRLDWEGEIKKEVKIMVFFLSVRIKPDLGVFCNWEVPLITLLKVIGRDRKSCTL